MINTKEQGKRRGSMARWMTVALGVCVLQVAGVPSANATALPTSGSCGIQVNRVLAAGDNAVLQQLAIAGTTTGSGFDLSIMGVLDFTHNTWTLSRLTRQYSTPGTNPAPTDTVTIISGTMAPGTPLTYNPTGTYPLVLTTTGYMAAGSSGTAAVPPNNTTTNLLVMPVNGGKTLLIQNQTGGNGGGVCQF
ncbi:MAG: hypothetical protein G3H99_07555 [Ferrovum sp.]|nr:hypothetical protein [Ferrovum sp.]